MDGGTTTGRWTAVRSLDWASVLPAACALHCTLTPLLASVLPFVSADHRWEWLFWGVAVIVGWISLRISWPAHGRIGVLLLAAVGAGLWGAAIVGWVGPEALMAPLGGLLQAAALWWNGRLRHAAACDDCGCRMHG